MKESRCTDFVTCLVHSEMQWSGVWGQSVILLLIGSSEATLCASLGPFFTSNWVTLIVFSPSSAVRWSELKTKFAECTRNKHTAVAAAVLLHAGFGPETGMWPHQRVFPASSFSSFITKLFLIIFFPTWNSDTNAAVVSRHAPVKCLWH